MTSHLAPSGRVRFALLCIAAGAALGALGGQVVAAVAPPSEHKGLTVETLGVVPAGSMEATLGLTGHKMQLRAITIEPGGQIAKHGHETRPGLVKVVGGSWIEGRPEGERTFGSEENEAIVEDEHTVHWFFNGGDEPATAIVCDIVPEA